MRCLSCQYSLENLTPSSEGGHRCPECGRAFDPNDRATWHGWTNEKWARQRFALWLALFVLLTAVWVGSAIEIGTGKGTSTRGFDLKWYWTLCLMRTIPVAALWSIVFGAAYWRLRPKGMSLNPHERTIAMWIVGLTVAGLFGALVAFLAPHLRG